MAESQRLTFMKMASPLGTLSNISPPTCSTPTPWHAFGKVIVHLLSQLCWLWAATIWSNQKFANKVRHNWQHNWVMEQLLFLNNEINSNRQKILSYWVIGQPSDTWTKNERTQYLFIFYTLKVSLTLKAN